ncbi:MAG TPA: hypothetical protein VE153_11445 [Myxococcus sp.]|nr:hypothetical protein [Myxococcus sp.]
MMLPLLTASVAFALGQTPASTPVPERPVQARLSFVMGDEDFDAPDAGTRLHAALEARSPELASGLRAEAALSFFLNTSGAGQTVGFVDNSSFLRLRYRASEWSREEGLMLNAYPLSSTRLHLGYEHPVTWARQAFPVREPGGEPALELRLDRKRWNAWVAAKSARVNDQLELEVKRRLGVLVGGGVDVVPSLRVELKAGTVDRGPAPGPATLGEELPVRARGVSGRVQWQHGAPVGTQVDLSLYEGDPAFFERFFTPETYPGGVAATVALEGSLGSQRLEDPERSPGTAKDESFQSAALVARLKADFLRVHALAYYRTATFLQADVPGFPPFQAFTDDNEPRSEVSATLGVDYRLEELGLTPGLLVRATVPAAFTSQGIQGLPTAERVFVLLGRNRLYVLPEGEDRQPVLTVKATLRWDLGTVAGVLGELAYTRDPNRTTFRDDVTGVAGPVFETPGSLGGTLLLQARF